MPTGQYYSLEFRKLIYLQYIRNGNTPEWMMNNIVTDPTISIEYLTKVCKKMEDPQWAKYYLLGAKTFNKTGRNRKIDPFELLVLKKFLLDNDDFTYQTLTNDYNAIMFGNQQPAPNRIFSISTLSRSMIREGFTIQVPGYTNFNRDEVECLEYLEHMSNINPEALLDIDETSNAPDSFRHRVSHAPRGVPPVREQIIIGNRTFSTLAALGVHGIICYSIYEGTIGADEFMQFLDVVEPRLLPENWSIIDNARIHHTIETTIRLELRLHGRYTYCARYSPHLKPIERVFALIKEYVRQNEQRALLNPVGVISEAFDLYSVGGARGGNVYNMFNLYRRAHYNYNH